ncbi:MAG: CTP-dependent riboflavin kinase, partial [Chloroflexi bacterium]|nr:CTP-dependent riboflavin kinase [Chloroflexota bacterium]
MPDIVFLGTVFSGEGRGRKFVCLPWVKGQIEEKLGFSPYLGTLNLRLSGKEVEKRGLLQNAGGLVVEPQTGYYPGVMFRATIDAHECAVVIPIMPNYPSDVLEVIAPVYLR